MKDIQSLEPLTIDNQEELLAVMVEIGREINEILSLDELLERIAQLTRRFIDYQIFAILLVDEESNDLFFKFMIGYPEAIKGTHIKIGEGLVGTAAQRREAILVEDVTKDSRYIKVVEEVR